jgi:3-hydroxybutyryl-CoA dehydrogenase
MKKVSVALLASADQQQILQSFNCFDADSIVYVASEEALLQQEADVFVALLPLRHLHAFRGKPLLFNETCATLSSLQMENSEQVARFCGWPTFWERPVWEIACFAPSLPGWLLLLEKVLCKKFIPVADVPGLVAPSVVASVINEAYHAMAEQICTAADLDKSLILGTNYPYGPLEWAARIGPLQVSQLLQELSHTDKKFLPHPNLVSGVVYEPNHMH